MCSIYECQIYYYILLIKLNSVLVKSNSADGMLSPECIKICLVGT